MLVYLYNPIDVEQGQQIEGSVTLTPNQEDGPNVHIRLVYKWEKALLFFFIPKVAIFLQRSLLLQIRWPFLCERSCNALIWFWLYAQIHSHLLSDKQIHIWSFKFLLSSKLRKILMRLVEARSRVLFDTLRICYDRYCPYIDLFVSFVCWELCT